MGFFGFGGLKIRCPYCGQVGKYKENKKKDETAELSAQIMNALPDDSLMKKIHFENLNDADYVCQFCNYKFSHSIAKIWEGISTKFGDQIAIKEYRDTIKEFR